MDLAHLMLVALLCAAAGLAVPVSAAASDVTVTSYRLDPAVLMRGDVGTLTVTVANNGAETVAVGSARLFSNDIATLDEPYLSVGDFGANSSREFTFTVRADAADGTYYPTFYLDFRDAGSLRSPIPVQVESTPLQAAVVRKPDAFGAGREADVALVVGNPRPNGVSGVQVIPEGAGVLVTPSSAFIGALASDQSATVLFNVTPQEETELSFRVVWRNGINTHTATLSLPITFSEDKKRADPILTSIEVVPEAGRYRITGDIANAGLEPARSVVITTGPPAVPVDPYRVYVVGTLDPDDFAGFEVTFRADGGAASVPLVVEYRDVDGNVYTATVPVEIGGAPLPERNAGYPVAGVAVVVLVAAGVAGAIIHSWRRA